MQSKYVFYDALAMLQHIFLNNKTNNNKGGEKNFKTKITNMERFESTNSANSSETWKTCRNLKMSFLHCSIHPNRDGLLADAICMRNKP